MLRSWLALHTVGSYAPYLPAALVDEDFAFSGRVLSGAEELRERWKRGVGFVEGVAGFAVGREYVSRHFPPAHKERMTVLVDALMDAYRSSIQSLEWMTPATRDKALAKLEKFTPKIGYPDEWRDYEGLDVVPGDLVATVRSARRFDADFEYAKVGGPIDEHEWHMSPQTVNAYYNPGRNEIVFPAAILQPPFFDAEAEDAVNFGGIGAVIGHEVGHGFDDQVPKYDGDGNLASWWTIEDREAFDERAARLITQYSQLSPREARGHPPRQRRPHDRREHRRPRRPVDRGQGLPRQPHPGAGRGGASTASPACSACSCPGRRCGAARTASRRRSVASPWTRTRPWSSAATRWSGTSRSSMTPSTCARAMGCTAPPRTA